MIRFVSMFLIFLLVLPVVSFAEQKEGKIDLNISTVRDAVDNLRTAKDDYQKRKNDDLINGIVLPACGVLELGLASSSGPISASIYSAVGVLFIFVGGYYLFFDMPETNKKLDSVNKSIKDIEIEMFEK